MPYLIENERVIYNTDINRLIEKLNTQEEIGRAGAFNYIITRIALGITRKKYWCFALTVGTIICAVLELYRRWIAKYEDEKIKQNGDVK